MSVYKKIYRGDFACADVLATGRRCLRAGASLAKAINGLDERVASTYVFLPPRVEEKLHLSDGLRLPPEVGKRPLPGLTTF